MYKLSSEQLSFLQIHTTALAAKVLWRLKNHFGSYSQVVRQPVSTLRQMGLTERQAMSVVRQRQDQRRLEVLHELIEKLSIRLIFPDEPGYPVVLTHMPDPPAALYIRGTLEESPRLSVVGSRKSTAYGEGIAYEVAAVMAKLGVTIVSGLAYGIDAMAHRGAVKAKGKTIGVLGCGLDRMYPWEHKALAEQMIDLGGAVMSEFPLLSTSYPHNFPIRNRIIATLSTTTLVVEGGIKSGAMITAREALSAGRHVWAVPGDIGRESTEGPLDLLRNGAPAYVSINDMVGHYGFQLETPVVTVDLDAEEQRILEQVAANGTHIDQLAEALQLDIGPLSSKVIMLELKGVVRHEGAGVYRRII